MRRLRDSLIGGLAVIVLAMMTAPVAIADNLVSNGSFETSDGCTSIPGTPGKWCSNNDGVIRYAGHTMGAGYGTPPDGSWFEIVGSGAPAGTTPGAYGTVAQTINGFTAGSQYTLTFDLLPWARYYNDGTTTIIQQSSSINVSILNMADSSTVAAQTFATPVKYYPYFCSGCGSTGDYAYATYYGETLTFTATGSSLLLEFTDPYANEDSQGDNPAIDAVDIEATSPVSTPEPGAALLLATGILGLLGRRNRTA